MKPAPAAQDVSLFWELKTTSGQPWRVRLNRLTLVRR
ncbi:hypothetical protein SMF913_10086 [Streptomyces malaysiensis]|uniref:Uncharacterized protein n=1 Tax=Streptomyces malaysiensis TaxID=92644 RepID=A0A2J7Z1B5_STRMQ|nr:hypothetical protein SMF913_10086 [Streptomyces malaysiensis]